MGEKDVICYQDGVYLLLDFKNFLYKDGNGEENLKENLSKISIVYLDMSPRIHSQYGGRVEILGNKELKAFFKVDGISIVNIDGLGNIELKLSLPKIVSYLNAIEANGVEAFIENYKKSLEFAYSGLKELAQETESKMSLVHNEDDGGKSLLETLQQELKRLKSSLFFIFSALFSLHVYMPAGLENEKVRTAYQAIIDSLT